MRDIERIRRAAEEGWQVYPVDVKAVLAAYDEARNDAYDQDGNLYRDRFRNQMHAASDMIDELAAAEAAQDDAQTECPSEKNPNRTHRFASRIRGRKLYRECGYCGAPEPAGTEETTA